MTSGAQADLLPIDRDQVVSLIRDQLADILEMDPSAKRAAFWNLYPIALSRLWYA